MKAGAELGRWGQAPHEPTETTRNTVKTAAGFGLTQPMIGDLIGISEKTLVAYYPQELAQGKAFAVFKVAQTLFTRATSGKDLGAAIFYLKSQGGFREKHVLDDPAAKGSLAELVLASMSAANVEPDPLGALEHATAEDKLRVVK